MRSYGDPTCGLYGAVTRFSECKAGESRAAESEGVTPTYGSERSARAVQRRRAGREISALSY